MWHTKLRIYHKFRLSAGLGLLLLFLAALSACGRPTTEYTDNKDVRIESIVHKVDGEFLVVYAVLRNNDRDDVNNSVYRMEWYDAQGFLLEKSNWRPLKVKGGAAVHVRERSTIPGAKEYTLVISNDAS